MLVYLQMIETPEDRTKFEILYTEYRGLMYHIAYDILKNDRDAEDAVHNAFVAIAEKIEKIHDPKCPNTKGYIVTIVESKAIDLYRKKQRRPETTLDDLAVSYHVDYAQSDAITRCMTQLPARYRHVLLLKYQYGFEMREVAQLLNISEANAYKLDQRAKARLRETCVKEGIL